MAQWHHITITARYEPGVRRGRTLASIAPELRDARLLLVEDHLDGPLRMRTWAGFVDERTFERFASEWLWDHVSDDEPEDRNGALSRAETRTFDGMNWEVDGVSPIVSVSVQVVRPAYERATYR